MGILKWMFGSSKEAKVKALVEVIISRMELSSKIENQIGTSRNWKVREVKEWVKDKISSATWINISPEVVILRELVAPGGKGDKELLSKLGRKTNKQLVLIFMVDTLTTGSKAPDLHYCRDAVYFDSQQKQKH